MQRSGVTLQRSLDHYFSSDTSPSRSKTSNWTEEAPCRSTTKSTSSCHARSWLQVRSWWIIRITSPLIPSLQVRALQQISPQLRNVFKTNWQHVIPITMCRSNIAPKWCDNFLARSENAPITILIYGAKKYGSCGFVYLVYTCATLYFLYGTYSYLLTGIQA